MKTSKGETHINNLDRSWFLRVMCTPYFLEGYNPAVIAHDTENYKSAIQLSTSEALTTAYGS